MRVTLPVWNGRVSPVFDTARRLLVVDVENGEFFISSETTVDETPWPIRVKRLLDLGVHVLICCGISPGLAAMITASGIRVIPGVAGDVDEVLKAFSLGQVQSPRFFMPGWGARRRRRFRGGRGAF